MTTVKTRADNYVESHHGVQVSDPFRWLEDSDSAEVADWTAAQNEHTRQTLGNVPGRELLEQRFWQLFSTGAVGTPVMRGLVMRGSASAQRRYFYLRRDGAENQAVLYVRDGLAGDDRVLLDVNIMANDGAVALDWWYPSEDGRLLAYGLSRDGSEKSTLNIRDVDTGDDRADQIPHTRHTSLTWEPDGLGFYYTRYPAPGSVPPGDENYFARVFHHRLGSDPAQDALIFGEGRPKHEFPTVRLSPNGRWLVIAAHEGWSRNDLYLLDRATAGNVPVPLVEGETHLFSADLVLDDAIYVRCNDGAPRYQVFRVDPRRPHRSAWVRVIAESERVLEQVSGADGRLVVLSLDNACSHVALHDADGALLRDMALPGLGTVTGLSSRWTSPELFFSFVSFVTPTAVYRHEVASGVTAHWRQVAPVVAPAEFVVERHEATSRDGTKIPLFLVSLGPVRRDSNSPTPTLLYGYGGFNINLTPTYSPSIIPFLEAGGLYVVAVLRGGGELGEAWHQAGMGHNKQNVFDDFIAAAEYLQQAGFTNSQRLAIAGRSNGGLLVGAVLTQRPDLFRAVVCGVPLLDMIRYHHFRIAKLWIPEYGSPDVAEDFATLLSYSPYHRVQDGVAYPAVFLHTAAADSRVDPMHARKMTARLQAATSAPHPILLRLEDKAGHGAGKPLAKVIGQLVDEWAFLYSQLGLSAAEVRS